MAAYANPKYPRASRKLLEVLINGNSTYIEIFLGTGVRNMKMGFYEELVVATQDKRLLGARRIAHAKRAKLHQEFKGMLEHAN